MSSSTTTSAVDTKSSRAWCTTLNNPGAEEYEHFVGKVHRETTYYIIGKEKGESGTPHLQGYMTFNRAKTLAWMKSHLSDRAHWEIARGDLDSNRRYCMKEGDYLEGGTPPVKEQGKRTDIELAVASLRANDGDVQAMAMEHPEAYLKYAGNFEKLSQRFQKRSRMSGDGFIKDRKVIWLYGPTGVGKTRWVHGQEDSSQLWISGRDLRWWQSYDMEPAVLLDDFRGDFCKYHELLRILDKYQCTVENKGGSVSLQNVKRIYVTSCYHPRHVYDTREDIEQLIRRIDTIWYMDENGFRTDVTKTENYPDKPGPSAPGFTEPPVLTRTRAASPTPTSLFQTSYANSSTNGSESETVRVPSHQDIVDLTE